MRSAWTSWLEKLSWELFCDNTSLKDSWLLEMFKSCISTWKKGLSALAGSYSNSYAKRIAGECLLKIFISSVCWSCAIKYRLGSRATLKTMPSSLSTLRSSHPTVLHITAIVSQHSFWSAVNWASALDSLSSEAFFLLTGALFLIETYSLASSTSSSTAAFCFSISAYILKHWLSSRSFMTTFACKVLISLIKLWRSRSSYISASTLFSSSNSSDSLGSAIIKVDNF